MGSGERFLANQRLFNVGVTRARDGVTVITDDQTKLARQLDRTPGDNVSALEVTGNLVIDRAPSPNKVAPLDLGPIPKDAFADTQRGDLAAPARSAPSDKPPIAPVLAELKLPEKAKGLEL